MPYRARGVWVLVYKNGRWVPFKRHPSPEKAKAHAAALNIHAHKKKK